ncbi:hypothetical protein AVEN_6874-1 [Araneus ventricosus]|uniref:Uncharacterized protein n=1 Tax=Araneus ventricosus TaxID=182803 RepID=A0A4Y2NJW6_ARAVE|nr:hypothetical protein AVEN_6874-1 [Araneus ventricosus]
MTKKNRSMDQNSMCSTSSSADDCLVSDLNPLIPKPAVTGHATSILEGRISASCCSESGEKAVESVVIKLPLVAEIRDERPSIHIFHHAQREEKGKRGGRIYFTYPLVNNLRIEPYSNFDNPQWSEG